MPPTMRPRPARPGTPGPSNWHCFQRSMPDGTHEGPRQYRTNPAHCPMPATHGLPWRGAHAPPVLFLVLHVTPIGGVLPRKKGLEDRLNFLRKHRTLLIRLHGIERLPYADGKAAVGIIDVLSEPPTPQARNLFARHS